MRTRADYLARKFGYSSRAQNKHDRIWHAYVASNIGSMLWRYDTKLIAATITNYNDNSQALRIMDNGNRKAPVIHRLNALLAHYNLGAISKIKKTWIFTPSTGPGLIPWLGVMQLWIKPPDKNLTSRGKRPTIKTHLVNQLNQYPPGSYQLEPDWKKTCTL